MAAVFAAAALVMVVGAWGALLGVGCGRAGTGIPARGTVMVVTVMEFLHVITHYRCTGYLVPT